MGNTRAEINQYLEHHGFKMGDEHDEAHHHKDGSVDKVVADKEVSSLIKSLNRKRLHAHNEEQ